MTQLSDFLAPLEDLAVVRIDGADASAFLHSQLSNDIAGMSEADARLAAYCSPKGRMLASLVVWRETAAATSPLLAMTRADLVEPLLKRLRMFVLRSKVAFETAELRVHGVCMSSPTTGAQAGLPAEDSAPVAWQVRRGSGLTAILAPTTPQGPQRWWMVAPQAADPAALAGQLGMPLHTEAAWKARDIAAGLGWVEKDNMELFIPQGLNYDLVGGVSFTKGCYPGQEIVARAHFRGTVKRRAFPATCHLPAGASLRAGADVHDALRPGTPVGRIINVATDTTAPAGTGLAHLLVELAFTDIGSADFRVVSPEGPALSLLPLPYPLDAEG